MRTSLLAIVGVAIAAMGPAHAQQALPAPDVSPAASVSQRVGITDITVTYHRPGVKGRTIWGELVPYGQVWRAGANENTTISFTDPVSVDGQHLAAGTYGLHMIPTEKEWTIIFSSNSTSWGSFSYDQSEDVLRVRVMPVAGEFSEWLGYSFDALSDSTATLSLAWERLRVPIHCAIDTRSVALEHIRHDYLRGLARFGWQGWNSAADYCNQHNINLDEALSWVDRSIRMNENFDNLWVKAELLRKQGHPAEADTLHNKALSRATEIQVNAKGYQYLQNGNTAAAIALFTRNVKAHPESWNVYDSLAEACERSGDNRRALDLYQKALKKVADETQKERLEKTIARLKKL